MATNNTPSATSKLTFFSHGAAGVGSLLVKDFDPEPFLLASKVLTTSPSPSMSKEIPNPGSEHDGEESAMEEEVGMVEDDSDEEYEEEKPAKSRKKAKGRRDPTPRPSTKYKGARKKSVVESAQEGEERKVSIGNGKKLKKEEVVKEEISVKVKEEEMEKPIEGWREEVEKSAVDHKNLTETPVNVVDIFPEMVSIGDRLWCRYNLQTEPLWSYFKLETQSFHIVTVHQQFQYLINVPFSSISQATFCISDQPQISYPAHPDTLTLRLTSSPQFYHSPIAGASLSWQESPDFTVGKAATEVLCQVFRLGVPTSWEHIEKRKSMIVSLLKWEGLKGSVKVMKRNQSPPQPVPQQQPTPRQPNYQFPPNFVTQNRTQFSSSPLTSTTPTPASYHSQVYNATQQSQLHYQPQPQPIQTQYSTDLQRYSSLQSTSSSSSSHESSLASYQTAASSTSERHPTPNSHPYFQPPPIHRHYGYSNQHAQEYSPHQPGIGTQSPQMNQIQDQRNWSQSEEDG